MSCSAPPGPLRSGAGARDRLASAGSRILASPACSFIASTISTLAVPLNAAVRAVGAVGELAVTPIGLVLDVPAQRAALSEHGHRPWPLAARPLAEGQTWQNRLFAHWAVQPGQLRPLVPSPLELDKRDGQAWL